MSQNNRRNMQKAGLSWFGFVVLVVVMVFLGRSTYGVYKKSRLAAQERMGQMNQLAELQARKTNLEVELAKLKTERGVEEELRNRYEVGKPGEEAVMIVDDKGAGTLQTDSLSQEVKATTTNLWNKFFGN